MAKKNKQKDPNQFIMKARFHNENSKWDLYLILRDGKWYKRWKRKKGS